ncbi:hypothetical protein HJFPF1_12673 [Paramyrothecium foliicola]|nr:hypothetical protein HJFPF1_12673 [Paramyrothecium foliicola]
MCNFDLHVILCGCKDWNCKMREAQFNSKSKPHAGHVKQIYGCYRNGPMCIKHFDNNDPHRLLVRWGMDASNGNSTQDCEDATYSITGFRNDTVACQDCLAICNQQCKVPEGAKLDTEKRSTASKPQKEDAPASFPFLPGDAPLPPPGLWN